MPTIKQPSIPISYAVGYDISCKNHYYLIMDLLKMADQKMYQDKHYKKSLTAHPDRLYSQNRLVESISTDSLKEKISTILTNSCRNKQYAFLMTDVDNFHLINDYWGYETGTAILNFLFKKMELFPQTVFVNRYHSDVFACIVDITGQNQQSFREKVIRYNKQTSSEILEAYPVNYLFLNTGIYYLEGTENFHQKKLILTNTNIVRRKAKTELSGVCEYSEDIARDEQNVLKPFIPSAMHWSKKNFNSISSQRSTENPNKFPVRKCLSDGKKMTVLSGFPTVFCQSLRRPVKWKRWTITFMKLPFCGCPNA